MSGLNFDSVKLKIGWTDVETGAISITGLEKGSLTFKGRTPQVFKAHITKATAKDINWILPP